MVRVRINRDVLVANRLNGTNNPPISIERNGIIEMAFTVDLIGGARVIYQRVNPAKGEAQLWIECGDVVITSA